MKKLLILCLCFLVLTFSACKTAESESERATENADSVNEVVSVSETDYMAQEQGICVLSACRAEISEDSTDSESVESLALIICNNSDKTLKYGQVYIDFPDGTYYSFTLTTLPPGEYCRVVEDNNSPYRSIAEEFPKVSLQNLVFFLEEPSVYSDILLINGTNGIISIKNISETEITENIIIYYKDYINNTFTSGVTYRVTVKDGLAPGEIKQVTANHFRQNESKLMFVQLIPAEVE